MPPCDPEWVEFVRTGSEAAFRAVVERHAGRVHAVAARQMGPHAHLAADVTQRVFTRLARQAATWPPGLVLGGWLYHQSRSLAIDTRRSEERRLRREHNAAMNDAASSPVEPAPPSELLAALDDVMARLCRTDREALILRYFEDRSLRDVGDALCLSPDAAQKRVSRALAKARVLLARRGLALSAAALTAAMTSAGAIPAPASLSATQLAAAALQPASTASGAGAGFLTTLLMTHTTSALAGAAAGLLLTGALYWRQEQTPALLPHSVSADQTPPAPPSARFAAGSALDRLVEEARTVEEIVEALRRVLEGPPGQGSTWISHALLSRVQPEQYLDFLRLAEEQMADTTYELFLNLISFDWAEANPEATVRALFASDQGRNTGSKVSTPLNSDRIKRVVSINGNTSGTRQSPLLRAFRNWVDRDAQAATQWLTEHRGQFPLSTAGGSLENHPGSSRTLAQELAEEIISHAGNDGLASALRAISQLSPFIGSTTPSVGGMGRRLTTGSPSEIAEALAIATHLLEQNGQPILAKMAGASLADQLTGWRDDSRLAPELRFQAGLALVAALSTDTYKGNGGSGKSVSQGERLSRASQLAASLGQISENQLVAVVRAWSLPDQGDEHNAFFTWLRSQPKASAALETGARQLAGADQASQALLWADALEPSSQRESLLRGIYRQWLDQDSGKAQRELPSIGLSAEAMATLQALTSPQ